MLLRSCVNEEKLQVLIMKELGTLHEKDSSDEAVGKYWEEFIAENPLRVVDKFEFIGHFGVCRDAVVWGRNMTLEAWLCDRGALTYKEAELAPDAHGS